LAGKHLQRTRLAGKNTATSPQVDATSHAVEWVGKVRIFVLRSSPLLLRRDRCATHAHWCSTCGMLEMLVELVLKLALVLL
jgi:hypothetical protein